MAILKNSKAIGFLHVSSSSYSKRAKSMLPFFILSNNDPGFFAPCFLQPIFWTLFFQGHKPTHVFKTKIVGADWLDACMSTNFAWLWWVNFQNKEGLLWIKEVQDSKIGMPCIKPCNEQILLELELLILKWQFWKGNCSKITVI